MKSKRYSVKIAKPSIIGSLITIGISLLIFGQFLSFEILMFGISGETTVIINDVETLITNENRLHYYITSPIIWFDVILLGIIILYSVHQILLTKSFKEGNRSLSYEFYIKKVKRNGKLQKTKVNGKVKSIRYGVDVEFYNQDLGSYIDDFYLPDNLNYMIPNGISCIPENLIARLVFYQNNFYITEDKIVSLIKMAYENKMFNNIKEQ